MESCFGIRRATPLPLFNIGGDIATTSAKLSSKKTTIVPFMYHGYGVTLVSEIRLTLPKVLAHGANKIVVLTTRGTEDFHLVEKDMLLDPDEWFQQTVFEDGKLYMRWKDWFDFLISSDGRRVLCRNLSDRTLDSFEAYLTNFAVSAALVQQGEETLHATVVD